MKHLKYLRESISFSDFEEEGQNYLAYLIDDGFKISFLDGHVNGDFNPGSGRFSIIICKENYFEWRSTKSENFDEEEVYFNWLDIKDYLLPYLEIVGENFDYSISVPSVVSRREVTINKDIIFSNDLDTIRGLGMIEIFFYELKDSPFKKNKLQKFGNYIKKKLF